MWEVVNNMAIRPLPDTDIFECFCKILKTLKNINLSLFHTMLSALHQYLAANLPSTDIFKAYD